MAEREIGFLLPEGVAASSEPQTIAGIAGEWTPGEAKAASELGLSVGEVRDLISSLGLPLKEKRVEAPAEDLLDRTGGLVSGATGDSAPETAKERSGSDVPGLSEAEAEERKRWDAERASAPQPGAAPEPPPVEESAPANEGGSE